MHAFINGMLKYSIGTIMHFSDAQPEDFFTVDPKGILVKVSINSVTDFDPTRSINLSASIKDSTGDRIIAFPLEVVSKTTQAVVHGIFNDSPALDIYILKLAPQAIENLKTLHKERTSGIKKRVGLTAGVNFSRKPGNTNTNEKDFGIDENTVLSVALKLTQQSEFMTLIDNWKVEIGIAET
jgi:hypothetical protein